jgi:hypothetical protein
MANTWLDKEVREGATGDEGGVFVRCGRLALIPLGILREPLFLIIPLNNKLTSFASLLFAAYKRSEQTKASPYPATRASS